METLFLILKITAIFATFYVGYVIIYSLIMKYYKCTKEEAIKEFVRWLSLKDYNPANDNNFLYEVQDIMRIVLGDDRCIKLYDMRRRYYIIEYCSNGVSCLNILAPYENLKERDQLETMLIEALTRYLKYHGGYCEVLGTWKEHPVLKLPYIQLLFAKDLGEYIVLKRIIENKIANQADDLSSTPPTDDEEDDIL